MLYLKINTPEGIIYQGEVKEVVVPTQAGEIGILPKHIPLVSVVKPGILKIKPKEEISDKDYIWDQDWINISVGNGLIFVDGKNIIITVSKSVVKPENSIEVLERMKQDLEKDIEKLKVKGEVEDIEKALLMMQTIEAEIKLLKKKGML